MGHQSQMEQPEVKAALAHAQEPAYVKERAAHLDAQALATGGRWLDPQEAHNAPMHHIHVATQPEVADALARRADPGFRAHDEQVREARALAQGGRWMEENNMPRDLPTQAEQPEVQAALHRLHDPEVQAREQKKAEARARAQGGRWES